jgi:aminomethyltransferase
VSEAFLKRTPLYDCHVEAGGRLVPFAGWEMPVQYGGVIEEHRAVRGAAGLFDVSHMGEITVRGDGAEDFLQGLTPNDVSKLRPGRAHYSGLLTPEGTYIDDLLVYQRGEGDYLLVVNAANVAEDLAWVVRHAEPRSDVRIEDVSDDWALLALQGPRAVEILKRHTEQDLEAIRYYRFAEGTLDGKPVLFSRTGYTGEDGFELYLRPADAADVWRLLLDSGRDDGLVPAGLGARDTLRLEAGMALYGHELDRQTTPYDAGLDWVVKLDSVDAAGSFLGRDALLRQREQGRSRALVGFEVTGRGIAREGHAVVDGGEPVGGVTSGTWSPTFEKALGMAYVPPALAATGGTLTFDVRGRQLAAQVVDIPFYQRPR